MIRKIASLIVGVVLSVCAFGQSIPNGGISQNQIWTTAQWLAAWQSKADAFSPVLTSPTATGGTYTGGAFSSPALTNPVGSTYFSCLPGFGGLSGGCTAWNPFGNGNWNQIQSFQKYNPTEWQIYSNAAQGIATVTSGTNHVTLVSGTPFDPAWVGLNYFYWNGQGFKVSTVTDSSHLTVQTTSGSAVSFGSTATNTFYFVTTSAINTCNVIGTAVTYVSGQPFIPFYDVFFINGTLSTIATFNSATSLTLSSSAGTLVGATCAQYVSINNELSNIRLQGLSGASEENFVITETPAAAIIQTSYAGSGQYRPIIIENGEQPSGTAQIMAGFYPNATLGSAGFITFGGGTNLNNESVAINPNSSNVNFMLLQGGTTGTAPSIAFRGSDTTVGGTIDVQGGNSVSFSSHAFTNTEFQVFGVGGTSWLGIGSSSAAAPTMSANGAATNISIQLVPKGPLGVTYSTGPIALPSSTVAALPTCNTTTQYAMAAVTDATAPTYNAALTGGGTVKIPVFCNGSAWAAH